MKSWYPPIEPHRTGLLRVSSEHQLYWEECGNPKGKPILFVHGGPGAGTTSQYRQFFDPKKYRIFLFDQRGCGKSLPCSSLQENTTWHLVADIEKLRAYFGVKQWVVFGGSWGSTLSLAYAETYPEKVEALILRGIFLGRPKELYWFYQFGAHHLFPDAFDLYVAPIPSEERGDLIQAYYKRLTSTDSKVRAEAAQGWAGWEGATLRLRFDPSLYAHFTEGTRADHIARIECHYFVHRCFFQTDNWLIEQVGKIRSIPAVLIHGRYDIICPFENAWELHKAWPQASLEIIPDAGHASSEPGILDALIRATDRFGV